MPMDLSLTDLVKKQAPAIMEAGAAAAPADQGLTGVLDGTESFLGRLDHTLGLVNGILDKVVSLGGEQARAALAPYLSRYQRKQESVPPPPRESRREEPAMPKESPPPAAPPNIEGYLTLIEKVIIPLAGDVKLSEFVAWCRERKDMLQIVTSLAARK